MDPDESILDPDKSNVDPDESNVDPDESILDPDKSNVDPYESIVDQDKSMWIRMNQMSIRTRNCECEVSKMFDDLSEKKQCFRLLMI